MNTLKFSLKKDFSSEMHNLEVFDIHSEKIFGIDMDIYNPCNLNIFVTCICHNKCFFCINDNFHNTDITDELYYSALEKTLFELKNKCMEITITGGEPTLLPERFVKTIKLCNELGFPCRTVSTTGKGIFKEYNGIPLYQHMIENNFINNINISRMHYEDDKNKEIFKGDNLSNSEIEKLSMFFKMHDSKMRVSCNLINGYIDNFNKILYFVDYYRNLNIDIIMFRELIGNNSILLSSVFNNDLEYITTLVGLSYNVNVYYYKDMVVKHYITKKMKKNYISSLSLRNGVLSEGFKNKIIDLSRKD